MSSIGTRRLNFLLAMAGLVVSGQANGEQLQLGLDLQSVYNSNFFSSAANEDRAISLQLGPNLGFSDPDGRFQYDLSFNGAYQLYVDQSGVNAWESRLRGRGTYEIDRRTRVRVTERFRDISNLRFSRQDIELGDSALDPNQARYFRNDLEIQLTRDLTRYFSLSVSGAHHWIDFLRNFDRSDSQSYDVETELRYQFTPQHSLGAGVSYTQQHSKAALSRLASRGDYVSGFLNWNWVVSDAIQIAVNGGPSWVRSQEDDTGRVEQTRFVGGRLGGDQLIAAFASCGMNDAGQTVSSQCDLTSVAPTPAPAGFGPVESFNLTGSRVDKASDVTFFGGATFQLNLADWNFDASYTRRQSTTSGDGLASSLDRAVIELEYAPRARRVSFFIAGSWDRRETLTEATVVDFIVIDDGGLARRNQAITAVENRRSRRDGYTAITGIRAAFVRGQSGTLEFRYRRTERREQGINRPEVDTFFVLLSFDYAHDVIRF